MSGAHVLVLRPEPGASATAALARERGLDVVSVPLFEIERVDWRAPSLIAFDGLLLTSANAVHYGGEELRALRSLKVYAVGGATAEAARMAGFEVEASGESGVDALLGSIDAGFSLLHLCGADRHEPERLLQRIARLVVYRSTMLDAPDLSAAANCVALLHSPRAARRFAELTNDRSTIRIAAISAAAAAAAGDGWAGVDVADKPTDHALLALAARLCNKPAPE